MKPEKWWAVIDPAGDGHLWSLQDTKEQAESMAVIYGHDQHGVEFVAIPVTVTEGHGDGWIGVDERLPEESGRYNVCVMGDPEHEPEVNDAHWDNVCGGWSAWYLLEDNPTYTISHWRPLPDPPSTGVQP